jgi:hypothetical protein
MEKKGAIGVLLEKVFSHFIPYMTIFLLGRDMEAAEVALNLGHLIQSKAGSRRL